MNEISTGKSQPSNETNNAIKRILKLLGNVVLIPVYPNTKKPVGKSWQLRTLESMNDWRYLASFTGKNIGVLLGNASGGLCTIDLDSDADLKEFLDANPRLRETTCTRRVRGGNVWIYLKGEYPDSCNLVSNENGLIREIGEWRANGNQTLIWGKAIDEKKGETEPVEYKFLNEVPPVHIGFDEINFPKGCFEGRNPRSVRLDTESCITESLDTCKSASLDSCISASLHNKAVSVLANIKARQEAMKSLAAKHPNLEGLYCEFIEPRFQAIAHARNGFIVKAVPFLYRCVAPKFVQELVGCFYDCNRALFNDPREQHMKEANAMLENVAKTYLESLNVVEREIYDALPEPEQIAFRICRDLALLESPDKKRGSFYMSFVQLGNRLGIYPTQAQRIMQRLESYGLIKLLKKGTMRALGVRGEAGEYEWTLI